MSEVSRRDGADIEETLATMKPNHEQFCDHMLVDWSLSGPPSGVGANGARRTGETLSCRRFTAPS